MARTYTKRSEYWENRKIGSVAKSAPPIILQTAAPAHQVETNPFPEINYGSEFDERTPSQTVYASNPNASPSVVYRGRQSNDGGVDFYAFQNIKALPSALGNYMGNRDFVGVKDAIDLCVRAYGGVPVLRNAIEVSVEFSNQPLWIKCDNKTVKTFFREWFEAIGINKLKEQFFREYYRSGNVFLYKFDGKFGPNYYKNMQQSFGAKENRVPIRYELLNPSNVFVPTGLTTPYTYARMLSTYDLQRLKNPLSEQDKQVYNSLPEDVKAQLKSGAANPYGIWIPMDPKRLRFAFYKKQSYEPMAIPMAYPVLPSVEWKLALTKMDMSLARTIERAILLITTGEGPNEYNGGNGINQNNIARLQSLFNNQTLACVLVADYTTKGEWLIPEIQDILGPEKYEIVDRDIKEGLQSILMGDDKFANAQIKAKVFIQRLVEGQNVFLNDFLMQEIKMICDTMGFRTVPKVGFQKINLSDEIVFARVATQMAQLGLLTADELNTALETGVLPDKGESEESQREYKALRDKGLYMPLTGGPKDPEGRPAGSSGVKQTTKQVSPQGTSRAFEDDRDKLAFSVKKYTEYLTLGQNLVNTVEAALQKKFKVKTLNDQQKFVAKTFAKTIMSVNTPDKWLDSVASSMKSPPEIPAETSEEIEGIQEKYEVDDWDAAILRNCKINRAAAKMEDFKEVATIAAKTAVSEAKAATNNDRLTIELKQEQGKPKTVSVVKTANGFEFTEVRKD
jgi:hypothetical protein